MVLPSPVRTQPYALFTEYSEVPAQSTEILNFAGRFPVAFSIKHSDTSEKRLFIFSITLLMREGYMSSTMQVRSDTLRPKSLHLI